jgi:hypothetical protein
MNTLPPFFQLDPTKMYRSTPRPLDVDPRGSAADLPTRRTVCLWRVKLASQI